MEKKSRRMELAIYCLSRALESFALCLAEWGLVRRKGTACHPVRVGAAESEGSCVIPIMGCVGAAHPFPSMEGYGHCGSLRSLSAT